MNGYCIMLEITSIPSLQPRKKSSHKGDYGRLLILAGSHGMLGAGCLTTMAALRSGVGLVTWGVPHSLFLPATIKMTCAMVRDFSETESGSFSMKATKEILSFARNMNVVALGPGISRNEETFHMVEHVLQDLVCSIVLDADGIVAISKNLDILEKRKNEIILTPHPGEFSTLLGKPWHELQENKKIFACKFAKKYKCILVLKCNPTIVTDGNQIYQNISGNPGMATGGSGDVLTGVISSLWAQGFSSWDAAVLGVYIHGVAGDFACQTLGEMGMIASDIVDMLPKAFLSLKNCP